MKLLYTALACLISVSLSAQEQPYCNDTENTVQAYVQIWASGDFDIWSSQHLSVVHESGLTFFNGEVGQWNINTTWCMPYGNYTITLSSSPGQSCGWSGFPIVFFICGMEDEISYSSWDCDNAPPEIYSLFISEDIGCYGCTNTSACNYEDAAIDDDSCILVGDPCDDGNPNTVQDDYSTNCECIGEAIVYGCTNPNACNFNWQANQDDQSCYFPGESCGNGEEIYAWNIDECECVDEDFGSVETCLEVTAGEDWLYTYNSPGSSHGYHVEETSDGNFIMTGNEYINTSLNTQIILQKVDPDGNLMWSNSFGGSGWDEGQDVKETNQGGFVVVGGYNGVYNTDIFLLITNEFGEQLSFQTFGGSDLENGYSVDICDDGGYILCGYTRSYAGENQVNVPYVIKLGGETTWYKAFGSYTQGVADLIRQTNDGGYVCLMGGKIVKLNADGDIVWTNEDFWGLGGTGWASVNSFIELENGDLVFNGSQLSNSNNEITNPIISWVCKTDSYGEQILAKTYQESVCKGWIEETNDGGFVICNDYINNGASSVTKTDSFGNFLWSEAFDDGAYNKIKQTSDDGFILVGFNNSGGQRAGLMRLGIQGCTDPAACNYEPYAIENDNSCINPGESCNDGDWLTMDDVYVSCDDGNCYCQGVVIVNGCNDMLACNYNVNANQNDGSCYFIGDECDDFDPFTGNDVYNESCECDGETLQSGCTSELACNYDPEAEMEDWSCLFIGESCDDEDPNTINDAIQEDCECVGIINSTVDELEALSVLIYPNPASNNLTIDLGDLTGLNTTIKLYDSSSKLVFEKQSTSTLFIDVSVYAKGLYTLELSTSDKVLRSQVVIE